jgi:hypothetical protein
VTRQPYVAWVQPEGIEDASPELRLPRRGLRREG